MTEELRLILVWLAGCALGVAFFAGLWWTVQLCLSARHPALWMIASLLVRTAMLLAGFYSLADGRWQRLLVCVLGFVTARVVVTRLALAPLKASDGP
ncbi:MAG: ATP synthase subunit I [Planctomycetota bacterium]|jgi:F1F0 ATPase subunit 2|nr:ATP synthase subunit I [Planctomycetota bacterium]